MLDELACPAVTEDDLGTGASDPRLGVRDLVPFISAIFELLSARGVHFQVRVVCRQLEVGGQKISLNLDTGNDALSTLTNNAMGRTKLFATSESLKVK